MGGGLGSGFNVSGAMQYDRGVLLLDDFEASLNWIDSGTGADFSVSVDTNAAWVGTKGLNMATRTTDPADGDIVTAYKWFTYPVSKLLVCRLRWAMEAMVKVECVTMRLYLYNEVRQYLAALRVSPQTPEMARLNSGGTYTAIGGYGQTRQSKQWDILEMQVDIGLLCYKSCMSLGVEKDLAGNSIQNVGASTDRCGKLELEVESDGAANPAVYFDSIYVGEFEHF